MNPFHNVLKPKFQANVNYSHIAHDFTILLLYWYKKLKNHNPIAKVISNISLWSWGTWITLKSYYVAMLSLTIPSGGRVHEIQCDCLMWEWCNRSTIIKLCSMLNGGMRNLCDCGVHLLENKFISRYPNLPNRENKQWRLCRIMLIDILKW